MTGAFTVRRCHPGEVAVLRQQVLRPHQRLDDVAFRRDLDEGSAHFCAEDTQGGIVCVASVCHEAPPWSPGAEPAWRLRGMATAPEWRGKGAGSQVLAAVVDHVAQAGGGLLWCNARLPAVGFYQRAGMSTTGEAWRSP